MQFSCDKSQLMEIINTVQRAVMTKSTNPVLECIKITADARGSIVFTGNNMELCIDYNGDCNIPEGGTIALNSKMFGDIVRKLPEGIVYVSVNPENNATTIKCERSEFHIEGLEPKDFPQSPEFDGKYGFSISQLELKKILRQTLFAVATSPVKPILTGMLFEIENNMLTAVTLDGARLALRKCAVDSNGESFKFVVPSNTLRELLKILKDDEENVTVAVSEKHCLFEFEKYKVISRLLEGEFLKYRPLLSTPNSIEVVVETKVLAESLERASLLLSDEAMQKAKKPVKIRVAFEKMEINCITTKGSIHDVIPVHLKGDEIEIGFNYKYLLEAIRATEEDSVKLEMSSPNGSCFVRSIENHDNYTYIVQPIRLRS